MPNESGSKSKLETEETGHGRVESLGGTGQFNPLSHCGQRRVHAAGSCVMQTLTLHTEAYQFIGRNL